MIEPTENKEQKQVDEVLQQWSQGDYVLGEEWFIYRFNNQLPLTEKSKNIASSDGNYLVESEVRGFFNINFRFSHFFGKLTRLT